MKIFASSLSSEEFIGNDGRVYEYEDYSSISGVEGYAHLGVFQSMKLNWLFGRTWLQNENNIKWLISIPLSILTAYITTILTR